MRYLLLIVWIGFIGYALLLYIWQTRLPVNEEQTIK